jgi:HAE1 family hydrophobic/amphiphilic exporter-1
VSSSNPSSTGIVPRHRRRQFIINIRAPLGSRIEITDALCARLERVIRQVIPPSELSTIVANPNVP